MTMVAINSIEQCVLDTDAVKQQSQAATDI
jgi:hypothetical protein